MREILFICIGVLMSTMGCDYAKSTDVEDLSGEISSLQASIDSLTASSNETSTDVEDLEAHAEHLQGRIDSLTASSNETSTDVEDLQASVERLQARIDSLAIDIQPPAPALPKRLVFQGPPETDANKADTVAVSAIQYVKAANLYFDLAFGNIALLEWVTPEHSGDSWIWIAQSDDLTIHLTGRPTTDGVDWTIVLSGNMMGMTVKDWTAATGHTDELSSTGTFTVYMPNTTTVIGSIAWTITEDRMVTAYTETTDLLTGGMVSYHIVNRPDGSGSVTVLRKGQRTFGAMWDPTGVVT